MNTTALDDVTDAGVEVLAAAGCGAQLTSLTLDSENLCCFGIVMCFCGL